MGDGHGSVEVDPSEAYATAALNRPDRLNAPNEGPVAALHAALGDPAAGPPDGVLPTGRGRATCAGIVGRILDRV